MTVLPAGTVPVTLKVPWVVVIAPTVTDGVDEDGAVTTVASSSTSERLSV